MPRLVKFIASLAFIASASSGCAGGLAEIRIVDRTTGEQLKTWRYGDRTYVAGQPGHRYAVELANNTYQRILTVLSVDGVNAVSGQTAATSQRGYVLGSHQHEEI